MWTDSDQFNDSDEEGNLTFEDLAIDENLSDLERITEFSNGSIALQRLVHVRLLGNVARSLGYAVAKDKIIPLVHVYVLDSEFVVRRHLAAQLGELGVLCHEESTEEAYKVLLDDLLPCVARLLADEDAKVRTAAGEALVQLSHFVRAEHLMEHVLGVVLNAANDHEQEDLRMGAAQLLNQLALTFGNELCVQFVVPVFVSLTEDRIFRVRKAAALHMGCIFEAAGDESRATRLLPGFSRLCKDPIWGVRKACVESITEVGRHLTAQQRRKVLIPAAEGFLEDKSKWVQIAMYQQLGRFLVSIPVDDVTDTLLDSFLEMGTGNKIADSADKDFELSFYCAYSFPGVVQKFGVALWNRMNITFQRLARDEKWRVRRTLACSLHEVASIIGPDNAEADLLPSFDLYLKDLDEVKCGVVKHVSQFLGALTPACRESYLPILEEIQSGSGPLHWRIRLLLAQQLKTIVNLFSLPSTYSIVVPLLFRALFDDVADVRQAAYQAVSPLLLRFAKHNQVWLKETVSRIVNIHGETSSNRRRVFAQLCAVMFREEPLRETLKKQFVTPLLNVGRDQVPNLRIMFIHVVDTNPWFAKLKDTKALMETLRKDSDRDVALCAGATESEWLETHRETVAHKKEAAAKERAQLLSKVDTTVVSEIPVPASPLAASEKTPDAS